MKRRLTIGSALLLAAVLAVVLYFPISRFALLGFMDGEAFYEGKPTSYWIHALKKDDAFNGEMPVDVGKTLREGGPAAVPVLAQMLESKDVYISQQTRLALDLILAGKDSPAAIPALINAVQRGSSPDSRVYTIHTLAAIAQTPSHRIPDAESVEPRVATIVAGFRNWLGDDSPWVRAKAARALWQIEHKSQEVLPVLVDCLSSLQPPNLATATDDELLKHRAGQAAFQTAVTTLGEMGPEARSAVPDLIEKMRELAPLVIRSSGRHQGIYQIIRALAKIRPDVGETAPALQEVLKDENPDLRLQAAWVLAKIDPANPKAMAVLADLLRFEVAPAPESAVARANWRRTQRALFDALADLGPAARGAAPTLQEVLKHQNPYVRFEAACALAKIDPGNARAVTALVDLLRSEVLQGAAAGRAIMPQAILDALDGLGADGRPAVPCLIEHIHDSQRILTVEAVALLGPSPGPFNPLCLEAVHRHHFWWAAGSRVGATRVLLHIAVLDTAEAGYRVASPIR